MSDLAASFKALMERESHRCHAWLRLARFSCDLETGHSGEHQFRTSDWTAFWTGSDDSVDIRVRPTEPGPRREPER